MLDEYGMSRSLSFWTDPQRSWGGHSPVNNRLIKDETSVMVN